ncbi:MAG: hypothetical protein ABJC09_10380 [Terriglobia bacterium]
MGGRIQIVFFAAAVLARAGYINSEGPYVVVHSEVSPGSSSDSITYTSSFLLTINGGSGKGFFEPIAHVQNTWNDSDVSMASIQISCGPGCGGSLHTDYSSNTSYEWYGKGGMLPFDFGVPISLEITLSARNFGSAGLVSEAFINGFALVDPKMNQLAPGGVFITQAGSAPEPNSFWLLAPTVLFYWTARNRRARKSRLNS